VDGRLVWIWDAYTTTNQYPYSQPVTLDAVASQPEGGTSFPSLTGSANYIRNSVKVVVDAYEGTTTYYVSDESDPIIQVWGSAFPDLFTPMSEASPDLLAHFRYPENLFQVQAQQFTSYHVSDPDVFYRRADFWAFPGDPAGVDVNADEPPASLPPMRPYYVLMRLPGDTEETFSLILPFTPLDRQNMIAWLTAKSDPGEDYGRMISYEFPSGRNVDGPTQVFARINADAQFASERTLLGQSGSQIRFGDFLVVPVEDSLLYVQPVYVQSNQENAIPELRRVIVVNGANIGIGTTLREALADSLGEAVPPPPDDGAEPPPTGTIDEQVEALLQEAAEHFVLADAALRAGDLATYQAEIELAQAAIDEAVALLGEGGGGTPAETPSPSP
jgi:hypothetical protein